MVDVLIRNMDEGAFRTLKLRAVGHGHTLATEVQELLKVVPEKKGAAAWLAAIKPIKIKGKYATTASQNIDKIIDEAIIDDYNRHKRAHRKSSK